MNEQLEIAVAERIIRMTATEGWDDLKRWINEQIDTLTKRVMASSEPMLKERHEVATWNKLMEKIDQCEKIHMEAIINAQKN